MNILAFILARLLLLREGADAQTAGRDALVAALLPMPLGLVVAVAAGRPAASTTTTTTTGGTTKRTLGAAPPEKPRVEKAADAAAAIAAALAAYQQSHAGDRDGGDEATVDKGRQIVNDLWRAQEEAELESESKDIAKRTKELEERKKELDKSGGKRKEAQEPEVRTQG